MRTGCRARGETSEAADSRRAAREASHPPRTLAGSAVTNVAFADAQQLLEELGFEEPRVAGSHHIYARRDIPEQLNLQNWRGQAKPYLLRQLAIVVRRHDLGIEGSK